MRSLKMGIAMTVAVVTLAASAAGASASTLFQGTAGGSTPLGVVTPCDFQMNTIGTASPPSTVVLDRLTFAGRTGGPNGPCDPTTLSIQSNVTISFSSTTAGTLAAGIKVKDAASGCVFSTSSAIPFSSTGALGANGVWSGSGSATGVGFPCNIIPATISVSNGVFS